MKDYTTGIFNTSFSAREVLYKLESLGFGADEINVMATDDSIQNSLSIEKDDKAAEGGFTGATLGGLIGAVAAGLAATGAIIIPGVNLLVYGTAFAAAAGGGVGAAVGGLTGALIGLGVPEYEVTQVEDEVKGGAVLISVETDSDAKAAKVRKVFEQYNAYKIAA